MALLCPEEMHGEGKEEMEEEEAWPSSLPDLGRQLIQVQPVLPTLDNEMGKVPDSKGTGQVLSSPSFMETERSLCRDGA